MDGDEIDGPRLMDEEDPDDRSGLNEREIEGPGELIDGPERIDGPELRIEGPELNEGVDRLKDGDGADRKVGDGDDRKPENDGDLENEGDRPKEEPPPNDRGLEERDSPPPEERETEAPRLQADSGAARAATAAAQPSILMRVRFDNIKQNLAVAEGKRLARPRGNQLDTQILREVRCLIKVLRDARHFSSRAVARQGRIGKHLGCEFPNPAQLYADIFPTV